MALAWVEFASVEDGKPGKEQALATLNTLENQLLEATVSWLVG